MARSSLTLAAAVTAALPHAEVTSVASLSESKGGRFDAALAILADGSHVVVRAATDADSARELTESARSLRALSSGVRALLPFGAPEVLGQAILGEYPAIVLDFIDGYRIDAAELPPGPGAATSLAHALAAIHDLPVSVIREEGLPVLSAQQINADVRRVVERAVASNRVPDVLRDRWMRALENTELWRFESTVILGSPESDTFVFADDDTQPRVVGVLDWHGLSVGDPASDFQWLAAAPLAVRDVYSAYTESARRAPDGLLQHRARLYAELEFARWLVHGLDTDQPQVVTDAEKLLISLAEGTRGDDIVPPAPGVDDAIAMLGHMPKVDASADISMQTDAYDPEKLSAYLAAERDVDNNVPDGATAPIDLSEWGSDAEEDHRMPTAAGEALTPSAVPASVQESAETQAEDEEAARASAAALKRWATSED